jgi:alginate O-acetyltransferase complex protein AlgI
MLFNSINYFLFLAAVFVLNYVIPGRFRWIILLSASIAFYLIGGAETFFVPIIIIFVTFSCGRLIDRASNLKYRQIFFYSGLIVNLGLLIFYKYINFFIAAFLDGFRVFHDIFSNGNIANHKSVALHLVIPLGISYITFQALGYLIEIKRGTQNSEKNPGLFATYILFFPKLLSGPVERAHNFLPQLRQIQKLDYDNVVEGLKRILWGLFLKLVIANRLALYTENVLGHYTDHSGITLLIASIFFPIQLFADFGGYTEIAIGSARLLGYKLIDNFNRPFLATSVTEFWRRWHISLTTWVTDYIYNPIVIACRNSNKWAIVTAAMVTFLILGFWHGANWNFIIFGLLQGIILSIEFFSRKFRKKIRNVLPLWLTSFSGVIFTFGYFCFSLIFFKAANSTEAFSIIGKILTMHGSLYLDLTNLAFSAFGIIILLLKDFKDELYLGRFNFFHSKKAWVRYPAYLSVIFIIILFGVFEESSFIYLQF